MSLLKTLFRIDYLKWYSHNYHVAILCFAGFNKHYGNSRLKVSFRMSTKIVRGLLSSLRNGHHPTNLSDSCYAHYLEFPLYIIQVGLCIKQALDKNQIMYNREFFRIIYNPILIIHKFDFGCIIRVRLSRKRGEHKKRGLNLASFSIHYI